MLSPFSVSRAPHDEIVPEQTMVPRRVFTPGHDHLRGVVLAGLR